MKPLTAVNEKCNDYIRYNICIHGWGLMINTTAQTNP